MRIICVAIDSPFPSLVRARLDEIADRIPCIVKYFSIIGEVVIHCRQEDAAWVEHMLADLV